jgi:hypothetical protein
MKLIFAVICLIIVCLTYPPETQAIIFLPALILIPIAKVVAVVIAGLSFPVLGVGSLIGMLKGSSKKGVFVSIVFLITLTFLLFLILKVANPEHPLF